MSIKNNDIFCASIAEISESEKNVVSDIVKQINENSIIQFNVSDIQPHLNTFEYDVYKVSSIDKGSFLLKISFGESKCLVAEYNILRSISSLNCAPSAMNKFPISCFASEGLALLTNFISGPSVAEFGINNVFSDEQEIERFFRVLAQISSIDTKDIAFCRTEPSIAQNVGKLSPIFGEDFLEKFKKIVNFDDFTSELDRIRLSLAVQSSQFDLGKLVNASLYPDNIIFPSGNERKYHNHYILDWSHSFIGNPLYDFMNFILENRLFEYSDYYKSIYFKEFSKIDSKLAAEMKYMYIEYFNYFIVLKFWLSIVEYMKLCIESEFSSIFKIEHVRFIETLNYFKSNIYKIIPSCSKLVDKFMNLVYN